MKKIFTIIMLTAMTLTVVAQNDVKRIAILETVDQKGDVNLGTKVLLRQSITFGINRIPGYEAYNRVNMAQITGEQNFQRTGMVSDAQIKKLGEMTGAAYVLIAEAVNYDATHILVLANLVDVESGRVTNSSIPKIASIDPDKMFEDCAEVAKSLLGMSTAKGNSSASQPSYNNSPSYGQSGNQNFTKEEEEEEVVFMVVESMPEFPGGQDSLFRYLSATVKYPVIAQENGIQGRVICQFVVEKDGSIANIEVVRSGGDPSLDNEAIRVVQSMPKWKPGKQRNKNVRVKYTIPINFSLK